MISLASSSAVEIKVFLELKPASCTRWGIIFSSSPQLIFRASRSTWSRLSPSALPTSRMALRGR